MPRDASGNASLVASYFVEDGDDLEVSQHNPVLEDIAAMLTGSVARNGSGGMLAELNMGTFKATNLADGANPQDAATKAQVDKSMPVGAIIDFAGVNAPTGWLLCYGQAVSRVTYATLFTAIGTTWGAGDGSTTFNLPDFRGRVRAGKDNMGGTSANRLTSPLNGDNLAAVGGSESHTLTAAQMPSHTHGAGSLATGVAGAHSHGVSGSTGVAGAHSHVVSGSASPSGGGDVLIRPGVGNLLQGTGQPYAGTSALSVTGTAAANGDHAHSVTGSTDTTGNHAHTISGASGSAGSDAAHPNVQPTAIVNTIIKAF